MEPKVGALTTGVGGASTIGPPSASRAAIFVAARSAAFLPALPAPTRLAFREPPRLSRRPHILRGWGHGTSEQVLTGGAGAGGPDGDGAPGGARVAVGGDRIDRGEDRLFDGGPTEVGTPGRT